MMPASLIFVSTSEEERARFLESKKKCSLELDWHMLRTPEDLFEALSHCDTSQDRVIIVGAGVEGIGQLNFVDAIRTHAADTILVPVLQDRDSDTVNRAMMAGATAALAPMWNANDLETLLKRLLKAHKRKTQTLQNNSEPLAKPSNVATILSAKGGVGKSVLTAMLAFRFSRTGKTVAVVDCDVQFGDMQFLLGVTPSSSLFDAFDESRQNFGDISAFGIAAGENITLFSFSQTPERIELLYGKVALFLKEIAQNYDIVLVNTGSFWTLFQFEIIEVSSEVLCVTTQSIVSARATQSLQQLCQKMGVPTTQFIYVVNDVHPYGLGSHDIADVLSAAHSYSIGHINQNFDFYIDAGNCAQAYALFEQESTEFESLATDLAHRMNISLVGVDAFQTSMKKNPWWRFR